MPLDRNAKAYLKVRAAGWGKKPPNVLRHFIEKYSNDNDIIVDPFSGSGIAPIEAVLTNRRGIGIDINPIATHISYEMVSRISLTDLAKNYVRIKNAVQPMVDKYYRTRIDDSIRTASHYVWENDVLKEVHELECEHGGGFIRFIRKTQSSRNHKHVAP